MKHPALVPMLAGTVPPPDEVRTCLRAITAKPLPNYPDTEAAGSQRMTPEVLVEAYALEYDCLAPDAAGHLAAFIDYEEANRHLATGYPPEKGYTLIGAQHFEVMPHLFAATCGEVVGLDAAHVALARAQASALVDWAVKWAEKYAVSEVNSRALMWPLGKMGEVARVNVALGVHDDRPLRVCKAVVNRLRVTADVDANGCAWMTLNNHADPDDSGDGSGQADHDWQRASHWMGGGRGAWALGIWRDVLPVIPGVPAEFIVQVAKLHGHALRCQRYAYDLAAANGAPLGGCVDDYDPTPAGDYFVHANKDGTPKWMGTMLAFAVGGALTAKRHAPKHWKALGPHVAAYHAAADRFIWRPSKPHTMHRHSASVALRLAAEFGWRVEP